MKHSWYVAGDFETHCRFCFDTWRNNEYEQCSYSSNFQLQIPEELPELTEKDEDPFLKGLMEVMSRPICKECVPFLKQGPPSPLWHCPHKLEQEK